MRVVGKVFEAKPADGAMDGAHVGQRLREIRKLAGLTQEQLAERLNIGQAALSRVEKRRDILVSTLRDYLGALGATLRIDARFDDASALVANVHEAKFSFDPVDENQLLLPIIGEDRLPARRDVVFSIVRRQNIWHNSRRKLAECGPRLGVDVRRQACGVASAYVRWCVA